MKLDLKAVTGIGVSVGLLWWVFHGVDLASVGRDLAAADPLLLLATGAIATAGGLIRAVRWRLLLEPAGAETTLHARWASLNIGFMATNLFPARLGEIVRPLALSRMAPVSMSKALGTVVLERVLDAVALLILAILTVLSPAFPAGATVFDRPIGQTLSGTAVTGGIVVVLVIIAVFFPERVMALAHRLAARRPGRAGEAIVRRIDHALSGFRLVRQPVALAKAMAWSFILWIWMGAAFWTAFRAFGIPLGFTAAMFTECALSLFEALPAGPGFIGTMQAGVLASVHGVFGVGTATTLSMAVGYYLAGFIPVTALGLYYAWTMGLRLRSMGSAAESALEAASPEATAQPDA